jgi:hypothetical protein
VIVSALTPRKLIGEDRRSDLYDDIPRHIWYKTIEYGQHLYIDKMTFKEWSDIMKERLGEGVACCLRRVWGNLEKHPDSKHIFPK